MLLSERRTWIFLPGEGLGDCCSDRCERSHQQWSWLAWEGPCDPLDDQHRRRCLVLPGGEWRVGVRDRNSPAAPVLAKQEGPRFCVECRLRERRR
jgi:hypothetical protein